MFTQQGLSKFLDSWTLLFFIVLESKVKTTFSCFELSDFNSKHADLLILQNSSIIHDSANYLVIGIAIESNMDLSRLIPQFLPPQFLEKN